MTLLGEVGNEARPFGHACGPTRASAQCLGVSEYRLRTSRAASPEAGTKRDQIADLRCFA
jgi:hypothetical protein